MMLSGTGAFALNGRSASVALDQRFIIAVGILQPGVGRFPPKILTLFVRLAKGWGDGDDICYKMRPGVPIVGAMLHES